MANITITKEAIRTELETFGTKLSNKEFKKLKKTELESMLADRRKEVMVGILRKSVISAAKNKCHDFISWYMLSKFTAEIIPAAGKESGTILSSLLKEFPAAGVAKPKGKSKGGLWLSASQLQMVAPDHPLVYGIPYNGGYLEARWHNGSFWYNQRPDAIVAVSSEQLSRMRGTRFLGYDKATY